MSGPWEKYKAGPWTQYAPVSERQTRQTAVQQQMLKKREAELDKEERAAQKRLDRITSNTEKYLSSTLGKVVGTPAKLFGVKTAAEEALDVAKAERQETIERINRERAFIAREGHVAPKPTVGQRVTGTLAAIPRGAIEGTSQFLGTLGIAGSEGEQSARAMEQRGTRFAENLGLGANEAAEFDPIQRNLESFGSGLGSIIPYVAAEVVGRKAAPLTKAAPYVARGAQAILGAGQGATQARQQMDEFEQETGQKIDPTTRKLVQAGGGTIGLTELLPISRMVDGLPAPIRTAVTKRITDIVARTGAGKLAPEAARIAIREAVQGIESRAVGRIVTRGALPEAAQEGGAQLAQNVLERAVYNPDQDVMENVAENAILGGLVGGTVRGGVELTNVLGKRSAESRQRALDLISESEAVTGTYDINMPNRQDPTQLDRVTVQTRGLPDADGNVIVMQPDGIPTRMNMEDLERMRVPTEGLRATQIPETLSKQNLEARFVQSLGNTEPDEDAAAYITNVSSKLNGAMASAKPEDIDAFLEKKKSDISKSRISEDAKIARMLVLDEATKARDEYVELLTAPPEGTAPTQVDEAGEVGTEQVAPTGAPTLTIAEEIAQKAAEREAEQAKRVEALNAIASDPNYLDKVETFEALMVQNGFDAPTPVEVASLYDAMRAESDAETAAGQEKDTSERQQLVDRINIIESVLYDDRIPTGREEEILAAQEAIDAQIATERAKLDAAPNRNVPAARRAIKNIEALEARRTVVGKAENIDAKLRKKGYKPLYRREIERIAGVEAANSVFGPEGEYTQRRQALFDQVVADPTITDKYRGFTELLDQNPALGDPTVDEIRMLRGDAAPLETQIAQSDKPITTAQLPAEPGGLTAEFKDVAAREAIDAQIAVEQANLDAAPHMGAPAARRAINNIKALEAERDALGEAPVVEEAAPVVEEAAPVVEEAAPVAEAAPTPKLYHGGRKGMTVDDVQIVREPGATKQGRKGRTYGGFYATANPDEAQGYAAMGEGNTVYEVELRPDAVVEQKSGDITRLSPQTINEYRARGVDVVVGKDPRGRTEHVIINKDAVTGLKDVNAVSPATKRPIPEELPPLPTASPLPDGPPATPNRPRIETLGFAAENQSRLKKLRSWAIRKFNYKYRDAVDYTRALASIYGVTKLPPNLDVAHKFELLESRKIGNQMSLRRWYLDPLENKIKELEVDPQDVDMYLWARSAKDRNAMIRNSSDGEIVDGSGMSDADADMVLNELALRGLTPKLRQVAKIHDALVDFMGKQRVEAGMLSADAWKKMRTEQPFYTPLKGFALNGDMLADGDLSTEMAEAREAEARGGGGTRIREYLAPRGRTSIPSSPLANVMSDAQMAIARMERNRVAQSLLEAVLNDPETHAGVVKVFSAKKVPGTTQVFGDKLKELEKRVTDDAKAPDRVFLAKKDGDAFYLDFQDTDAGNALFRAFANMSPQELNWFMNGRDIKIPGTDRKVRVPGLISFSNGIKSLKTRFAPSYLLGTAWQRDFQEAILTNYSAQKVKGGPAEGKKIAARSAKYMFSPLQTMVLRSYLNGKDPSESKGTNLAKLGATPDQVDEMALLFDQFLRDGGSVGTSMITNAADQMETFKKSLKAYEDLSRMTPAQRAEALTRRGASTALKPVTLGLEMMDTFSQIIDLQARFATYRAALDAGIGRDDAASLALDSSLNLTRRGELASTMDTLFFFWSAGVEGGRKFVKQGLTSRNALKVMGAAVSLGIVLQFLNEFMSEDDDEDGRKNIYDVPDYLRQTRAVIFGGPGVNDYYAIPMAFSTGFAKYAGEQIAAAMLGDISPMEAAVTIADAFRNMSLPIRGSTSEDLKAQAASMLPDITQPFTDLTFNSNFFGGKIYREDKFGNTPPSELGREDTAEIWKWLARGANSMTNGTSTTKGGLSQAPEWYEYLASQYGGGLFNFGRDVSTVGADVAAGKTPDASKVLNNIFKIQGKGGEYAPMSNFYTNTDKMDTIYPTYKKVYGTPDADEAPEYDETDEAALAENQAKFPLQSQPEIMEAYGKATAELKEINKGYREGEYGSLDDKYDAMNEVYKEFNRTYNEVKKDK